MNNPHAIYGRTRYGNLIKRKPIHLRATAGLGICGYHSDRLTSYQNRVTCKHCLKKGTL